MRHEPVIQRDALCLQPFVRIAQQALRKGGVLWVVANRHLPYEAALAEGFKTFSQRADKGGFKVFEARK